MTLRATAGLIALSGLLLATGAARAQGLHLLPNVPEIEDEDLNDVALAVVDRPDPVIYYNPSRFQRYGPDLSDFFLAHEYGHIALHHTREGLAELSDDSRDAALRLQELDADCWAAAHIGGNHRIAIEAAIRFFTRLGPFRFDAVHPTGAQRSEQLLRCLPPEEGSGMILRSGETGVESGPVSGEPKMIRVEVRASPLAQDETGKDIQLWFDGKSAGSFSNMRLPQSIDVSTLSTGIHSYRMLVKLFSMDGQQQFQSMGSAEGRGYVTLADGDVFVVQWEMGHPPFLEIVPRPDAPGR